MKSHVQLLMEAGVFGLIIVHVPQVVVAGTSLGSECVIIRNLNMVDYTVLVHI